MWKIVDFYLSERFVFFVVEILSSRCCHSSFCAFETSLLHLFEVVERREDDLVTSTNETDGGQQLEDERLCPASTKDTHSQHLCHMFESTAEK